MEFDEYQRLARLSDQRPGNDPESIVIPALGLVAEAGSVANVFKKWLRDGITFERNREFVLVELGDVLWYVANIASRFDISLDDVARTNLARTESRYGFGPERWHDDRAAASLDRDYPPTEQFPRHLLFHFEEERSPDGQPLAVMRLVSAEPNPFPHGRDASASPKGQGFTIGDPLRNNSLSDDGYRYHDAIHLAFLAVLGWSPVLRDLLRLKRKSRPEIDDTEDAARAVDVEEGLATQLAERAPMYGDFELEQYVDNDTLDIVLEHVRTLEVSVRPGWLWKRAIAQGFHVMNELRQNHGGYVQLDLERHEVSYSRLKP